MGRSRGKQEETSPGAWGRPKAREGQTAGLTGRLSKWPFKEKLPNIFKRGKKKKKAKRILFVFSGTFRPLALLETPDRASSFQSCRVPPLGRNLPQRGHTQDWLSHPTAAQEGLRQPPLPPPHPHPHLLRCHLDIAGTGASPVPHPARSLLLQNQVRKGSGCTGRWLPRDHCFGGG